MPHFPFTSLQQWFPQSKIISLWESQSPPQKKLTPKFIDNSAESEILEREISQLFNPEMMVVPPATVSNGIGVLIIPGGSYKRVAFDKEGVDTATELSKKGYTVFIMTYRMPADGHQEGSLVSLADAQRAIRLIRSQADEWSLKHIGVMGFSAGGHIASSLATRYDLDINNFETNNLDTNKSQKHIDRYSARPDFVTLMYPVISMDTTIGHPGSRRELLGSNPSQKQLEEFSTENQVTATTPPCLLIHASDDTAVKAENSIVFWQALKAHNVPTELHIFEQGGHGFGIRDSIGLPTESWPNLFDSWVNNSIKHKV